MSTRRNFKKRTATPNAASSITATVTSRNQMWPFKQETRRSISKRSRAIAGSISCWINRALISPMIRVPSSRKLPGMRDCRPRRSARCRRCSGASRITSSIGARSVPFAWRSLSWETCFGSWSVCIDFTLIASINGSHLRHRVPAVGTRTIGRQNDPILYFPPFSINQPYQLPSFPTTSSYTFLPLVLLEQNQRDCQQNRHGNNKKNNYMLDISNKENVWLERQESRQVTFHFCERYAKKGDRRIKTEAQDTQPRMIRGSKIVLAAKGKNGSQEKKGEQQHHHKMSNFEILKRKISYLETQQFLGDKSQRAQQRQGERSSGVDYIVSGEFGHSKRISVLQKYRQNIKNIKRQGERRKSSLNLIIRSQIGDSCSKLAFQFPQQTQPDPQSSDWLVKKRQVVTQCAKRYFRPHSFTRSREGRLLQSVAEVKGRKLQQTGRAHKSTINFY